MKLIYGIKDKPKFGKLIVPVFLGSSFAFLGSMAAAFAGATTVALGYLGLILGAVFAGLVYVVIAIAVKISGVGWINRLMPAAVIGPTVAIIGLSLAGNAIGDLQKGSYAVNGEPTASVYVAIICGLVTLFVTMFCSVFGKKMVKLIPFIIGIVTGYAVAAIFTVVGVATNNDALKVIDFSGFSALVAGGVGVKTFFAVPDFTFFEAFGAFGELSGSYIAAVAVAYVPVAFVVFAEHIADHKNISSIVEKDLLVDPGLHRTLLGDGIGSMVGAFSGLKMIQKIDLEDNKNLFVVSVILIAGIGGLTVSFGKVTITSIACALLLGIFTNIVLGNTKKKNNNKEEVKKAE